MRKDSLPEPEWWDTIPPADEDAEEAVLGTALYALVRPEDEAVQALWRIQSCLFTNCFTIPCLARLYDIVSGLWGKGIRPTDRMIAAEYESAGWHLPAAEEVLGASEIATPGVEIAPSLFFSHLRERRAKSAQSLFYQVYRLLEMNCRRAFRRGARGSFIYASEPTGRTLPELVANLQQTWKPIFAACKSMAALEGKAFIGEPMEPADFPVISIRIEGG